MFVIIGFIVVIASVVVGFVIEGGNANILIQPVEAMIVIGVALGAFCISNPPIIVKGALRAIPDVIFPKGRGAKEHLSLLVLLYQLVMKMRRDGVIAIEADINTPHKSEFFHGYGDTVLKNEKLLTFLCDNLKVLITGDVSPHDFENLMEVEIETLHREDMQISHSIARIADAMPGLGLVAAVLGVVLTMTKIDQPPAVIGHSIAVALLGTFLGILLCYGIIGPVATSLEHKAHENTTLFKMVKIVLAAFRAETPPITAIEFARRVVPGDLRPTFEELDRARKGQPDAKADKTAHSAGPSKEEPASK